LSAVGTPLSGIRTPFEQYGIPPLSRMAMWQLPIGGDLAGRWWAEVAPFPRLLVGPL